MGNECLFIFHLPDHRVRAKTMFSLTDFEKYAKSRLDSNAWGYYSSGANLEQTLSDNEKAFQRYVSCKKTL